ncbi:MAG: prolipoprotein diacylglyceryl transferase [Proteobacteria bacterium]|nr:prolipoprotein diacylglyceryl transferase [Pseudomonadota bacterium]
MLLFPQFNPIALQLGPIAIHWYGLAYVTALLLGLAYTKHIARRHPSPFTPEHVDNLFTWVVLGVIVGGRLGYVLFYGLPYFAANPLDVFKVWQGGMSFHGGLIGVITALAVFCRKHNLNLWDVGDRVAPAIPIGLLLGRIANFINGELVGREAPASLPWSMIFPQVDLLPRHPSQLYEASLEGIALFLILFIISRRPFPRYLPSGVFLAGYALARFTVEYFRTPEITHTWGPVVLTQGQLLCLPMLAAGLVLLGLSRRRAHAA